MNNKSISLLYLILSLILLDQIDCGRFHPLFQNCKSLDYQSLDKINDIIAYSLVLLLFNKQFTKNTILLLIMLISYRVFGIIQFMKTKNNKYLKIFFDGINITIIMYYLSTKYMIINNNYTKFIIFGFFLKIYYEFNHHSHKYISS